MDAMPSWLIAAIALTAIHFVFREAVFEHASVRKAAILFPPVFGMRALFWLATPLLILGAYRLGSTVHSAFAWVYPIILISFALMFGFCYPGTLAVDDAGLSIEKFLGLYRRRINWQDVDSFVRSNATKQIVLYARDGQSIAHTQLHVDPSRYEQEVSLRVKSPPIHR